MPAPPSFRIVHGLPAPLQAAAARLYWQAFGRQILPLPLPRGEMLLRHAMRPARALAALDPCGGLIGLAGLRDASGGFIEASPDAFGVAFGAMGGVLRALVDTLYRPGPESPDMVLDGIVIRPDRRRQGVGRALILCAARHAAAQGYPGLRVELDAGNDKAAELYRGLGFQPVAQLRIGWPWSPRAAIMRLPGATHPPVQDRPQHPASPSSEPEA